MGALLNFKYTASWKEGMGSLPTSFTSSLAVHWMLGKKDIFHFRFDLDEEKLEVVPIASKTQTSWLCILVNVAVVCSTASGFQILEMGEGCSGWILKYRFDLKSAFPEVEDRLMIRNFSILCVKSGADEENDAEIVLAGNGQVVSCNLKSKTSKVLCSFPTSKPTTKYHEAFQFQVRSR